MVGAELYQIILAYAYGLPRIFAIFVMLPSFGRRVLPGSARNAVALSVALLIFPTYRDTLDPSDITLSLSSAILLKEALIGLLMGFALSILFHAVAAMGFLIDNQRGSTMASSVDPMTGAQSSPLGIFMVQVLSAYFVVSGAILVMLLAIYESFRVIPVTEFLPTLSIDDAVIFLGFVDRLVLLALLFAAPAMVAMFLAEFALGLISRFAPQLNVFFLAMPVKSAVGILLLALYITALPSVWDAEVARYPGLIQLVGGLLR